MTGGLPTVAVRVPLNIHAHKLISAVGVPVAAPSANISGRPSATCARYCLEDFDGRIDAVLDGGDAAFGLESTIVKPDGDGLRLLRPGAVTPRGAVVARRSGNGRSVGNGTLRWYAGGAGNEVPPLRAARRGNHS